MQIIGILTGRKRTTRRVWKYNAEEDGLAGSSGAERAGSWSDRYAGRGASGILASLPDSGVRPLGAGESRAASESAAIFIHS